MRNILSFWHSKPHAINHTFLASLTVVMLKTCPNFYLEHKQWGAKQREHEHKRFKFIKTKLMNRSIVVENSLNEFDIVRTCLLSFYVLHLSSTNNLNVSRMIYFALRLWLRRWSRLSAEPQIASHGSSTGVCMCVYARACVCVHVNDYCSCWVSSTLDVFFVQ